MNKRLLIVIGIVAIVIIAGVAKLVTRRPVGKKVMVYGAIHEFEIERLLDAFTEETGVEADYIRMSAGEITARIRAERARPLGDIVLGGPGLYHERLRLDGLLEKYESPTAAEIDQIYHSDPDGYWCGFYLGAMGFLVNEKWLEDKGLEPPSTWEDLLKPEYKGEVCMARPYTSGTAYTILCTQLFRLGVDDGWDYLGKLDKQIHHYTRSGAAPGRLAGAGEVGIGILFGHDGLKIDAAGYKVKLVYPPDTGWEIGCVSIIKGGPSTESARKFVDWMLGKDAGQLHTDLSFRISTRPDITMRPGTVPLEEIKLVSFDFSWAAEHYDANTDQWKALTGK